jgi:hypothetical protein
MTTITMLTVITEIPRFARNEKGQDERAILPQENRLQGGFIPAKANLNGPRVLE